MSRWAHNAGDDRGEGFCQNKRQMVWFIFLELFLLFLCICFYYKKVKLKCCVFKKDPVSESAVFLNPMSINKDDTYLNWLPVFKVTQHYQPGLVHFQWYKKITSFLKKNTTTELGLTKFTEPHLAIKVNTPTPVHSGRRSMIYGCLANPRFWQHTVI